MYITYVYLYKANADVCNVIWHTLWSRPIELHPSCCSSISTQSLGVRSGILEVNDDELVHYQTNSEPITWSYRCLRRYGLGEYYLHDYSVDPPNRTNDQAGVAHSNNVYRQKTLMCSRRSLIEH